MLWKQETGCRTRNYIEHFFILASVVSGFVSISALAPLVGTPIGFTSSAVELEISAIIPISRGKSV